MATDEIKKFLESGIEVDMVLISWTPKQTANFYGDEDVLPEEIREAIDILRKFNKVKGTDYKIAIPPTFKTREFKSVKDYFEYTIDLANVFLWRENEQKYRDKLLSWNWRHKK
jgi:hypothetical protein